jgi:hypothetical protein
VSCGVDVQMYGNLAGVSELHHSGDNGSITPQARRSFTLRTLDMTSLPMLSNTNTFHIGSPVSESIGAFAGTSPLAFGSLWPSTGWVGELRFSMRSIEAVEGHVSYAAI